MVCCSSDRVGVFDYAKQDASGALTSTLHRDLDPGRSAQAHKNEAFFLSYRLSWVGSNFDKFSPRGLDPAPLGPLSIYMYNKILLKGMFLCRHLDQSWIGWEIERSKWDRSAYKISGQSGSWSMVLF